MEQHPLISVIVPVYRVEAYLDRCLESLTGQTYENLEILLVDDGSPDRSGEICDAWAARDARIRVIHQANAGGGAARNAALDAAKGVLIAFADSDDYMAPHMLQYLYDMLGDADIAECGYMDTTVDDVRFPEGDFPVSAYTTEEALRLHIRDEQFRQIIWNKLYRRQVVGDTRFPVGTKIDDEYFTYHLLGRAKKLVRSDRICYAYRQQESSIMHQGFSLKRVEALQAKQQRLAYLRRNFPELVGEGREDLILTCLYLTQATLRYLGREERKQAMVLVHKAMEAATPFAPNPDSGKLRKLLLRLAQKDLQFTAKLLNLLIDLHILT